MLLHKQVHILLELFDIWICHMQTQYLEELLIFVVKLLPQEHVLILVFLERLIK